MRLAIPAGLISALLGSIIAAPAFGQVIQWSTSDGGNGHYFEFVQQELSWTDAKAAAQAMVFDSVHGHLATDTSAAENSFFVANYCDSNGNLLPGWLGGYQDTSAPDYSEPAGGWRWITGEPWSYTNWFPGMPDNSGGNQNYIRSQTYFRWDDFQDAAGSGVPGYYVEWAVPEPTTLLPLAAMAMLLRRRQTA